jgi:solute:Na+ symporter, SSS family
VTSLILAALAFIFAYAMYMAALVGRRTPARAFMDAGGTLPAWALMFTGAGIAIGGLGLRDHFRLTAIYGLPYSHIALGLTLVALCGAVAHKRLWLAARLTGLTSPIEIISSYFGSVTIRIVLIGVALVFAGPFAGPEP